MFTRKFYRRRDKKTGRMVLINRRTMGTFTAGEIVNFLNPRDYWPDMVESLGGWAVSLP